MLKVATKVIKAKVISPTKRKQGLLEREFNAFQDVIHNLDAPLYSATKQQAERIRKRLNGRKTYPLILRRDVIKLQAQDTQLVPYWFRMPVYGLRGGVWLPIKPHCGIPEDISVREAKLIRKPKGWFIYITIQKEVEVPEPQGRSVVAVDLGERYIATSVRFNSNIASPRFYGKEVRGIRRHYAWLRKRLQEQGLNDVVERIGSTERRKVDAILHQVSRSIVDEAKTTDSTIILGELKGIREKAKGKRMNRIISAMPYYRLSQLIAYKALWEGIPVVKVPEAYTSKACHRCGSIGSRPYQGLFLCHSCGLHYNADLNGAINISKRALDYMSSAGAPLTEPLTQVCA